MSAPITYDFSGTIVSIVDNGSALTRYGLSAGTSTFDGSFTYDPEIAFIAGNTTTAANYRDESAFELSITIDNQWEFLETNPYVSVRNGTSVGGGDLIGFRFHTADGDPEEYAFPTSSRYFFNIQLEDLTGTALSDTSLPDSIDIGDFGFSHMYIGDYDFGDSGYGLTGAFDSVTEDSGQDSGTAPIPEPSTILLLGGGLLGLGWYGRKRK